MHLSLSPSSLFLVVTQLLQTGSWIYSVLSSKFQLAEIMKYFVIVVKMKWLIKKKKNSQNPKHE